MVEMVVHRVVFTPQGQAIVLLADREGERLLPIWIGLAEASAIQMTLDGETFPRPLTHDLLANIITTLGYRFTRLEVTKLEDTTFYALIYLTNGEQELVIDSRPSDAIALAVRVGAGIYVAEQVLEQTPPLMMYEVDETASDEKFRELMESVEGIGPSIPDNRRDLSDEPEDETSGTEDEQ